MVYILQEQKLKPRAFLYCDKQNRPISFDEHCCGRYVKTMVWDSSLFKTVHSKSKVYLHRGGAHNQKMMSLPKA